MQNQTLTPLAFIRIILMAIGIILFLVFGNWSVAHLNDKAMARGTTDSSSAANVNSLLPR